MLDGKAYRNIEDAVKERMIIDEYGDNKGQYTINNIYYDTPDSSLIRTSLAKPEYKEKIRLRSYCAVHGKSKVFLEIKKKYNKNVNKRRTVLTLDEAEAFMRNGTINEYKSYMNRQVIEELEYALKIYNLEPKVFIAYDRHAYFGKDDKNFRITFDKNIRARRYELSLSKGNFGERIIPCDTYIMEVKTDGKIPLWLTEILSENGVYKTSFSKYGTEYNRFILNQNNKLKLYA
jgi:SPX domain protein involved in polyphosphate accumulation